MKLNTKKGGIELHADEKRTLDRAAALLSQIAKHGDEGQAKAAKEAEGNLEALGLLLKEDGE